MISLLVIYCDAYTLASRLEIQMGTGVHTTSTVPNKVGYTISATRRSTDKIDRLKCSWTIDSIAVLSTLGWMDAKSVGLERAHLGCLIILLVSSFNNAGQTKEPNVMTSIRPKKCTAVTVTSHFTCRYRLSGHEIQVSLSVSTWTACNLN